MSQWGVKLIIWYPIWKDMIPPATWFDFILATVALGGSYWWHILSQTDSTAGNRSIQHTITVLLLFGASGLLYFTLLRFGFIDAILTPERGFYGPFWRVLPAIAAEILSILLLLSVLIRRYL